MYMRTCKVFKLVDIMKTDKMVKCVFKTMNKHFTNFTPYTYVHIHSYPL